MAARKPLFMGTEGFSEEMALSDEMTLGGLTMGGAIAMGTNKITGAGAASASGDVLVYGQSSAELNGLTITAAADITVSGGGELTGLPATPSATAAASKEYVDAVAQGLDLKGSVVAIEVSSNIDVGTGTLGLTIDGIAIDTDGMRVLLTAQTSGIENGIWVAHTGAWTRPTDFAAGSHAAGAFTFVEEGTTYADTGWVCTTDGPTDVVGTDALAFTQFAGAGTYTGGDGIAISVGREITVDLATDPGLEFATAKLRALVNPAGAIERVTAGLGVKLEASNPSLAIVTNELGVKLSDGVAKDANGLAVALDASGSALEFTGAAGDGTLGVKLEASNPSLQVDGSNQLGAKLDGTKGAATGAGGIYVKIDGSTITFDGSGQLQASAVAEEAQRVENTLTTATDAVAVADPVYANGDETVGKADTTDVKARVLGIIRSGAGAAPQSVQVVTCGRCNGILTGATFNTPYYLQDGGGISTALPAAGKRVIMVGYAIGDTDMMVRITDYGKKAA